MKATLTFNLPEEQSEHNYALRGAQYSSVLEDLDSYLRSKIKYEGLPLETFQTIEAVRKKLHELLNLHGVDL